MLTIGQEVKGLPNIKSSIKRVKVINTKTIRNTKIKSALKTSIKKCKEVIANNDDSAADIIKQTIKDIDKAASKNILHKNNAARKKSKLAKAMNAALEANK
jgi:small subunit ribosomal protein S20